MFIFMTKTNDKHTSGVPTCSLSSQFTIFLSLHMINDTTISVETQCLVGIIAYFVMLDTAYE